MMDPEQRFLQSRQARLSASTTSTSTSHHRNEELSVFWSELRRRLKDWTDRLEQCCCSCDGGGGEVLRDSSRSLDDNNEKGSLRRQELQDLKEELQTLRQHCLHNHHHADNSGMTSLSSSSSSSSWSVPTDLPNADLRLLHAEFTRCSTRWESVHEKLFPRGKFTFRRYREELARRKVLGIPLEEEEAAAAATISASTITSNSKGQGAVSSRRNHHVLDDNGSIQNISDSTIHIIDNGTVQIHGREHSPVYREDSSSSAKRISFAAVLLRNVQNCTVQIDKALEALHLVDTSHVTVLVSHPIASSIHITNCHQCDITAQSQQLRIHESTGLRFHVQLVAGAILEESNDIVFVGGGGSDLDVKDFNWLRTGVPSPNFRIEESSSLDEKATEMRQGGEQVLTPSMSDDRDKLTIESATTRITASTSAENPLIMVDKIASGGPVEISSPGDPDSDDDDEL